MPAGDKGMAKEEGGGKRLKSAKVGCAPRPVCPAAKDGARELEADGNKVIPHTANTPLPSYHSLLV